MCEIILAIFKSRVQTQTSSESILRKPVLITRFTSFSIWYRRTWQRLAS